MSLRRRRALLDWAERTTPRSSRTTTTASSASAAARRAAARASTAPAACSTSARSRRCCCRRCGWASWSRPPAARRRCARPSTSPTGTPRCRCRPPRPVHRGGPPRPPHPAHAGASTPPRHQMIQAELAGPLARASRGDPVGGRTARRRPPARPAATTRPSSRGRARAASPCSRCRTVRIGTDGPQGLVLGYGAIPIEHIDEGLRRLAECLETVRCRCGATARGSCSGCGEPSSHHTRRTYRIARFTADTTAFSDALTIEPFTPTPQSTVSSTAHSTYAAARASSPADIACSW